MAPSLSSRTPPPEHHCSTAGLAEMTLTMPCETLFAPLSGDGERERGEGEGGGSKGERWESVTRGERGFMKCFMLCKIYFELCPFG